MALIGKTQSGANSEISLVGDGNYAITSPHIPNGYFRSGRFIDSGGNSLAATIGGWTEIQSGSGLYETSFSIYFGAGTASPRRYWYWTHTTGLSTWMQYIKVDMFEGNWSYGQLVGYKEYHIMASANSWSVTLDTSINGANFGSTSMALKVNGTTNVKIGGINTAGANHIKYRMLSNQGGLFSHNMTINFTDTNPFA